MKVKFLVNYTDPRTNRAYLAGQVADLPDADAKALIDTEAEVVAAKPEAAAAPVPPVQPEDAPRGHKVDTQSSTLPNPAQSQAPAQQSGQQPGQYPKSTPGPKEADAAGK